MTKPHFLRFSIQDQILFAKRLAVLIKAGIPIMEGLSMLHGQAKSRSSSTILKSIMTDVDNGQFLSTSMGRYRKVFGDFAVNIVRVGEISGTLCENLNYLAEELKRKQALRRKVRGAMIYPFFIVIATFGVAIMLTAYIFPKILPIFKSLQFTLPWTTRVLIFVSDILINQGLFILLGLVILIVAAWFLLRLPKVHFFVDRMILRVPLLGRVSQSYHMANFCRTLGLLIKSDVMIVEATTITADTTGNLAYRRALHGVVDDVVRGERMSSRMSLQPHLFPPMLTQMVTVGEMTGNLGDMLLYLADMYEHEVDDLTKNLSTVLEPALMATMGIIIGFIAISIITPIYEVTQHIHQ